MDERHGSLSLRNLLSITVMSRCLLHRITRPDVPLLSYSVYTYTGTLHMRIHLALGFQRP